MPPSPAMRCSPGRELRAENHKRGRSLEGGILFREKDDDLALFNEVQSRERDNFLLQSNDDLEDLFSNKLRYFSDYKLGITIPARGESSDLLNAEGDKNDYDWLLTPPDTPLFASLDDEEPPPPPTNLVQRGRPLSQPISMSRSSTMEKTHRSSRGSASPNRLSPSPRSSHSTYQSRGRSSSGPHSSPPPGLRPSTPTRRPSPPPSKPSTPTPRSSTLTPLRMSTGSSGLTVAPRIRGGNSPVKTTRGNSASPKLKAWQANIPGFSLEAPPNLRTSLADRPASYVRGSSPASRNGSKSGRQSLSPTASQSVCSSYNHDRDRFSSHSKGSVASSGDDDVDSLQSIPLSSSDHSAPRSISTFSNNRCLSSSKKPIKIVTSSSAPKRSVDIAIRQMDHRKGPQNMFRPLLSSVPGSTFYAGKSSAAHHSILSRNSSVTTSSNTSSDLGTSGAHDTEGSKHNQEDITSECTKVPYPDMQEVFAFDKADSIDEKPAERNREKLPDNYDDYDGNHGLDTQVVGDEGSSQHDTAIVISVTSVILDVKGDFSDAHSFEDVLLCSRCGHRYRAIEEIDHDLNLCTGCRSAEIYSVVTTSPKSVTVGKNSPGVSENILDHGSLDYFAPCVATPESLAITGMDETGTDCHSEPNRNVLPDSTVAQSEQILVSQRVGSQLTISSNTAPNGEIADHQLRNTSDYSYSKADVSEGSGIALLLTSSSGKGPIVRRRTFTATSITCDDFSYVRESATSTRSSFGNGTTSASSSVDFGSGKQMEARGQRQISSRKSDTENNRYEMYIKHQHSVSSLSGTSTHGFQASSLATSPHEESLDVSAIHVGEDNLEVTPVTLQDLSLASGSKELDNLSTDVESDNNWRTVSELSSHTTNIHLGDTSMASVLNIKEPALQEYVEDLANEARSAIDTEASCSHLQACACEEDAMSNVCTDRVDVADAPNLSSLDVISELESENDLVVSPDSIFDIDIQNPKGSINDLQDLCPPVASSNDVVASIEDSINQDHIHSILEESTVMLETQGGIHARSLTLEEATDTILFCSSIVHNLAYEAANIAIGKESSVPLESSKPVVTVVGKSNPDRGDSRARTVPKRNAKSQKARQKQLEKESKPPSGNMETYEIDVSTTRIVGAPKEGDSMKPPKLESKCNCAIM